MTRSIVLPQGREITSDEILARIAQMRVGCCGENARWLDRLALDVESALAYYRAKPTMSHFSDLYAALNEAYFVLRRLDGLE